MDVQRRSRGSATLPATRAATCFKRATPTRRYADTPTRASLGQSVSVLPVNRCLRCPLRFHGCLSLRINRAHRQAGRRKTENNDLNTFHTDTQRRCAVERENEGGSRRRLWENSWHNDDKYDKFKNDREFQLRLPIQEKFEPTALWENLIPIG